MRKFTPDDLEVGKFFAIREAVGGFYLPIGGIAFQIKAIALPFIVVDFVNGQTLTLDIRQFNLMRVPEEYVTAQKTMTMF